MRNVYIYLDYLLTVMPELGYEYQKNPEVLDKYLPWSEELPEEIRLNRKIKSAYKIWRMERIPWTVVTFYTPCFEALTYKDIERC